jgi:hypothetical protein
VVRRASFCAIYDEPMNFASFCLEPAYPASKAVIEAGMWRISALLWSFVEVSEDWATRRRIRWFRRRRIGEDPWRSSLWFTMSARLRTLAACLLVFFVKGR